MKSQRVIRADDFAIRRYKIKATKIICSNNASPRQRQGVTIYAASPIHRLTGNFLCRVYYYEQV